MQEDEVGSKGKVEEGKEEVTAEVIELVTGATDAEATDAEATEGAPSAADRSAEAPTAQSTSARACDASPRADR